MSARQECKDIGMGNLTELSKATGRTRSTLYNWYKKDYKLFLSVLIGAKLKESLGNDKPVVIGKKLKAFKLLFEIKESNNE